MTHLSCDFTAPLDSYIVSLEMEEQQKTNIARFSEKLRKFGDGDYLNVGFTASLSTTRFLFTPGLIAGIGAEMEHEQIYKQKYKMARETHL